MNLFSRTFINIKKQSRKNGLLLILTFLLGTLLAGAISIRQAIITTEQRILMEMPAVATIQIDTEAAVAELEVPLFELGREIFVTNLPDLETLSMVGNLPYVRAYDMFLSPQLFSFDLEWSVLEVDEERIIGLDSFIIEDAVNNFANWGRPYEGFPVRGVYNPNITDIEAGLISLSQGRTFTVEEISSGRPVAVVSSSFARTNELYEGAIFKLESLVSNLAEMNLEGITDWAYRFDERFLVHQKVVELEIIGIFDVELELNYELHQSWEMADYLRTLAGLHNRIYIPIALAEPIMREANAAEFKIVEELQAILAGGEWYHLEDDPLIDTIFLLNDPRDMEAFRSEANKLLPGFWTISDLSAPFAVVLSSMDTLLEMADMILWLAVSAMFIILTLLIVFLTKERRHEIGIYLALGEKKEKVVTQFLMEIFLVAGGGIVLSLFAGNSLAGVISDQILEQQITAQSQVTNTSVVPWHLSLFNPGEISVEEILDMYDTSLDMETTLLFLGGSALVILISTGASVIQLVRLNPKKVMM